MASVLSREVDSVTVAIEACPKARVSSSPGVNVLFQCRVTWDAERGGWDEGRKRTGGGWDGDGMKME